MREARPSDYAYERLADEVRTAIQQGTYLPGGRLPSEAVLATNSGLSRQTVRRVLHKLASEGVVRTEQGRGTFVAARQEHFRRQIGSILNLLALTPQTKGKLVEPLHEQTCALASERLGLGDDRPMAATLVRALDDRPLCVFTSYVRPTFEPVVQAWQALWSEPQPIKEPVSLVHRLDDYLGYPIIEADQVINAIPAPAREARALGVEQGAPVLEVRRTYLTAHQEPVLFTVTHFLPELYSYRVKLRRESA